MRRRRADVQRPYIVETYKSSLLDSGCARPRVHGLCCGLKRGGVRKRRADVQLPYLVQTYRDSLLDSDFARPRVLWWWLYLLGCGACARVSAFRI